MARQSQRKNRALRQIGVYLYLPAVGLHNAAAQGKAKAHAPAGDKGFGYDPVFFDEELGLTAAQMDASVKNARSHRGLALRDLLGGWPEFWKRAQAEMEK